MKSITRILGIIALSMTACDNPTNGGGGGVSGAPPDITWTVTASGSPTTSALNFNFSANPTGLTAEDIVISTATGLGMATRASAYKNK